MIQIPFQAAAAFTEEITLDEVPYRLAFAWNGRAGHWSLTFQDRDGTPLVEGIRVVPEYELIQQFPGRGIPPGMLFFTDPNGIRKVINRNDIPTNIEPVYMTEAEVDAI